MDKLEEEYTPLTQQDLTISDTNIKRGLLVCCYLTDFTRWHRAMVINPPNEKDEARLLFVDYGTVGMVHKKNIKFLFAHFLDYPRYANRGRFVNLKPPNREKNWNERQVNRFLQKISNVGMKATIVKMDDEEEDVYMLDIIQGNPSVNLKTWLIQNCLCEEFQLLQNSIRPMCYYFPTFAMLEKNYPAFHEKTVMEAKGVDYDLLVETNYLSCVDEQMLKHMPKLLSMLGQPEFKQIKNYYYEHE